MTQSRQHVATVDTLLNTLEAERYMREALLLTIVDELRSRQGLEAAAADARSIFDGLRSGELVDAEFRTRIAALRKLVMTPSTASAA